MRKKNKTIEALTGVCFMVALAGLLLAFHGFAWSSEIEGSTEADFGVRQEAPDNNVKQQGPEDKAVPAAAAQDAPAFKSRKEKLSYALGMVLGNQFRDKSIDVDPDIYFKGLKDGLSGAKTLLTPKEARIEVNALQSELKKKRIPPPAAGTLSDIKVSFKLDPRLTRAQYMGDRWVSPTTYTSTLQVGTELTVEARAQGLDAGGRRVPITPKWIPADPEMVTVVPNRGKVVKIIVKRPGQTSLKVVSQKFKKELHIKAMDRGNNAMQVEISQ